jgi:dCMP deaminase
MRISRDELLTSAARLVSGRSTCLRLQVGAVVALEGRILVTGYNGAPTGMPHCTPDICGPDKPCSRTVHAEANCIAFAARHGISLEGAFMYCTDSPCMECAKLIINSGIRGLNYQREYRDRKPLDLLVSAGILTIL